MITFAESTIGSSHLKNGKPMQDSSKHLHLEECQSDILLVSDGHGGEKYFRSDRGSKFAVEAAKEALVEFLKEFHPSLPKNTFRQRGVSGIKDNTNQDYTPQDEHEREFRQLFDNIKFRWCEKVKNDLNADPIEGDSKNLTAYGCTLMAAVKTPSYWLAFQLGDGKCIAKFGSKRDKKFKKNWGEPIPWDSQCFLNVTTSLCHEGRESFRYCYGNTQCPYLFIASDGMDDSYMPLKKLLNFYQYVVKVFTEQDVDYAKAQLKEIMPVISKEGSHDDISIAFWIEEKQKPQRSLPKYNKQCYGTMKKRGQTMRLKQNRTLAMCQQKQGKKK